MEQTEQDLVFMQMALDLAKQAAAIGEVPVGAVVVCDGKVVSTAYNRRETGKNALYHAELSAIDEACKALGGWRLHRCDLYVTLEPCSMCAGAIVNARIRRVIYGAPDLRAGAFGSVLDLNTFPLNHKPILCGGVMEAESRALLQSFFSDLRTRRQAHADTHGT